MRRLALGTALLVALTGCTLPWSGPDPEPVAKDAAAQLSAGKPAGAFDKAAAELWTSAVSLGVQPKVRVEEVTEKDNTATATLAWSWPVADKPWTYETSLQLKRVGETWQAQLTPEAIEPSLTKGATLSRSTLKAERGRILGADDKPLVTKRPVLRIGLDKSLLPAGADVRAAAETLARAVSVDPKSYAKRVAGAGPKAYVQAIVVRQGEYDDFKGGIAGVSGLPGARAVSDHLDLPPSRDFAPGLIGSVGEATAELIKESEGRLKPGDDTGLSGLQKRYDEQLGGTSGVKVVSVLDDKRTELFSTPATPGKDLKITIALDAQEAAVAALSGVKSDSSLVAIRPSTGEIVAAASGPGSGGLNTATFGKAAPGSTFKIVSALGLLRSGLKPSSPVECPATTSVNGKSFKNYSDYPSGSLGRIPLAEAVAQSCNTAFIGNHKKLSPTVERDAAAALGFGVDHEVGFPAYFGSIPEPASDTEAAADLIGQGKVQASAMSMATVMASVVAGKAVLPRLVDGVDTEQDAPAKPLTTTEADQLREMLRGVVSQGSGRGLQGVAEMAKTGTAEFGEDGKTHAWMVASKGDLAVAVYVEVGESGSRTAGPILKEFLSAQR